MLSLLPLDLLYLVPSLKFETMLRLPRLLKASLQSDPCGTTLVITILLFVIQIRFFFTFIDRFESRSSHPNFFR